MRTNSALNIDSDQSYLPNENPPTDSTLGDLFRQLLSYIERESAYSHPIRGYLFIVEDNNELSLYDAYNVDPQRSSICATVRKGKCHCGTAFSSQLANVIDYVPEEDAIQCEGICPDPHVIIPVWHNAMLVGLVNISLPNADKETGYTSGSYPAIFNLVSGYLGAVIANNLNKKKNDRARILLDAIDGTVLDLDLDGKVIDILSATNLLNVDIGLLIGCRLSDHFVGQDKQEIDNALAKLSANICKTIKSEYIFKDRYGESQPVELSLYPRSHEGLCGGFTVVCRDIRAHTKSEESFHALLESAPDAVIITDEHGKMTVVNDNCISLFGYDREELVGQYVEMLMPDQHREAHKGMRDDFSRNPHNRLMSSNPNLTARHKSGRLISVEISLSPTKLGKNTLTIASIRDITHRKAYEDEFRRLAFVTEHSPNPIMELDASGKVVYANKIASVLSLDEVSGGVHKHLKEQQQNIFGSDQPLEMLSQNMELGGRIFEQKVRYAQGSDSCFVYLWDITEGNEISNKLGIKAKTDALTGLSSRLALIASLKDTINTSNLMAASHTILYIDLDDFMTMSHSLSEEGRDALLKMVGCLLKDSIRQADTLARMRNDQFVVLLAYCPVSRGYQVAEKIKAVLNGSSLNWQQKDYTLTASIGVVEIVKSFDSYSEILESAESACLRAKENGKNSICLYNKKLNMLRMD